MEYCGVYLKIDYYTEMLKIHVFSRFTIKTPRFVDVLAPIGLSIVKTLTNVL